ncbi:hypothetical protein TNIN_28411 [Trichonephila inaurata madagascariensis]|uniref:Uncharacterized protein n=1 Tax=Trichonephila inaurata madagascariensis TaxID=2747483 RepID=A0A8X6YEX9_9ARAC|nr:hypothetical protein TNIN_28411 [Trichonephila inaurata madagascariensis]
MQLNVFVKRQKLDGTSDSEQLDSPTIVDIVLMTRRVPLNINAEFSTESVSFVSSHSQIQPKDPTSGFPVKILASLILGMSLLMNNLVLLHN